MASNVPYINEYAKHGFNEETVFEFLRAYAQTGSVLDASRTAKMTVSEGYKLVLLREFQDQLKTYNTLDNQALDVRLSKVIGTALDKALDLIENGEIVQRRVQTEDGPVYEAVRVPANLRDVGNALDKVFRARVALRESGVDVNTRQAEQLKLMINRFRQNAHIIQQVDDGGILKEG